MKITKTQIGEEIDGYITVLEPENGETTVTRGFFINYAVTTKIAQYGELVIPEGIEIIEDRAFEHLDLKYNKLRLPKSLKRLGEYMLGAYLNVKITYPGTSEDFKKIATVRKERVCESDGFDHYPYYSGGSYWTTHYHSFDSAVNIAEVYCESDGVTLLYGKVYRTDDNEPKIKA